MRDEEPISRGDIMTRVGVARDVMTFWIRGGVLQPIEAPTGNGKKLWFPWYEANIAAIMNQLRIIGVKIEGMLSIGRIYRDALGFFHELGLDRDQIDALQDFYSLGSHMIESYFDRARIQAIVNSPGFDPSESPTLVEIANRSSEDERAYWLGEFADLTLEERGAKRLTPELATIAVQVSRDDFYRHLDPYLSITERPSPAAPKYSNIEEFTYFWRVGEGEEYRLAWGPSAGERAQQDGAISLIAINVSAALDRVWNAA